MTAQPTLNLQFSQARFPDPRITFSRASTGTYIDALGRVRTAAINQPRFEWDPVTGQSAGMVIEAERTNLFTYNQDLSHNVWGKGNGAVWSYGHEAVDGSMTAIGVDGLSGTTAGPSGSALYRYGSSTLNLVVGQTYTVSFFIKAKPGGEGRVRLRVALGNEYIYSDLVDITAHRWERLSLTFTANNTISTNVSWSIGTLGSESVNAYICLPQLEEGDHATSVIYTDSSPVTRAADSAYVDREGWLNPAEGTIVVEVREPTGVTTTTNLLTLSEGASNMNRYSLQGSGSTLRILRSLGGFTANADLGSGAPRGQWNRVAFGYSSAGLLAAANGAVAVNSATMTTPGTLSRLYLGGSYAATNFSWIREVQYYPVRLSPEELVRITK